MIVYNVNRRWFALRSEAEFYRKSLALRPAATLAIEVHNRDDLAGLLNSLCEPGKLNLIPDHAAVVDRAYVEVDRSVPDCVPLFLIKDDAERKRVALDRFVRQTAP